MIIIGYFPRVDVLGCDKPVKFDDAHNKGRGAKTFGEIGTATLCEVAANGTPSGCIWIVAGHEELDQ